MANNRIYWAVQGVSIAPQDSVAFDTANATPVDTAVVHGLQTMGITTTFNLEQVFEIGQLAIYENIEDIPDIEVTMERVIDGNCLMYHLATQGASASSLAGRSGRKCNVIMNIYDDTLDSASGIPQTEVFMSGMYVSSLSFTMPVDGNCTESLTLVGNNKEWTTPGNKLATDMFDNQDSPAASGIAGTESYGGVNRRENVVFGTADYATGTNTILPNEIEGITATGTNEKTDDVYGAHIQSITVSADLGRDNLNELGRKGPYFRYVNFPVEVSTEIETMSLQGDQVNAFEDQENVTDQSILIVLTDSTKIDCGTKNKLSNISYGGGDAGGGNATATYSYTGFNELGITHLHDPG